MSEQRRLRAELRQGLHQFLMSLYKSYSNSMSHEGAVEIISACLNEEFKYFTKQHIESESNFDLSDSMKQLEQLARKEKDSVKQHELYEELETLVSAQEILAKYNTTEDNQ